MVTRIANKWARRRGLGVGRGGEGLLQMLRMIDIMLSESCSVAYLRMQERWKVCLQAATAT